MNLNNNSSHFKKKNFFWWFTNESDLAIEAYVNICRSEKIENAEPGKGKDWEIPYKLAHPHKERYKGI